MHKYLLIESRDPFEGEEIRYVYELAEKLSEAGSHVAILLVQEGVRAARAGEHTFWFAKLRRCGVQILADEASLCAQGITRERVPPWVTRVEAHRPGGPALEGFKPLWITDRPDRHVRRAPEVQPRRAFEERLAS